MTATRSGKIPPGQPDSTGGHGGTSESSRPSPVCGTRQVSTGDPAKCWPHPRSRNLQFGACWGPYQGMKLQGRTAAAVLRLWRDVLQETEDCALGVYQDSEAADGGLALILYYVRRRHEDRGAQGKGLRKGGVCVVHPEIYAPVWGHGAHICGNFHNSANLGSAASNMG